MSITASEIGKGGMNTTMQNFNKNTSADYKAIDLQRDKFNKTTTSGFGNF